MLNDTVYKNPFFVQTNFIIWAYIQLINGFINNQYISILNKKVYKKDNNFFYK